MVINSFYKGFYKQLGCIYIFMAVSAVSIALDINDYPVLQTLVETMSNEDGYPKNQLIEIFQSAKIDQNTLDLMQSQYESLPWYKYRKLFVNQSRINDGIEFWKTHRSTLNRAYEKFGVPQAILVALIGIETHYGRQIGDKKVLDSLVTLSATFPKRSKFFTSELRTFLNTTLNEKIVPSSVLGSFAGAIGIPQFMPTSYEAYAIDFNNNNQRDLVNEFDDAIGSVANYLCIHGWESGKEIYTNIDHALSEEAESLISKIAKPELTHEQLITAGIMYEKKNMGEEVALLSLQEENGHRNIVGYKNLYTITRYNPSVNYAMAITELAEAIQSAI